MCIEQYDKNIVTLTMSRSVGYDGWIGPNDISKLVDAIQSEDEIDFLAVYIYLEELMGLECNSVSLP